MADFGTTTSGTAVSRYSDTINTPGVGEQSDADLLEDFKREFNVVLGDSAQYIIRINDMDDARFNRWMGQSADGRKWSRDTGAGVFPWEGAADSRIWLIDDTINDDVRLMKMAASRARIQATAVQA